MAVPAVDGGQGSVEGATMHRRTRTPRRPPVHEDLGQDPALDARYGLEPVFEPSATIDGPGAGGVETHAVACPYCGESFETLVDPSGGSGAYIEDCEVCCQPIEFGLEVALDGTVVALTLGRGDQ